MPLHYFDSAATTWVCPEAAQAVYDSLRSEFGNPSSGYPLGRAAAARVKEHRAGLAAALGCAPGELFFTSCGTEGDNWAIRAAVAFNHRKGRHIVTTAIEHAAVLEPIRDLERQGYEATYLKPDAAGHIDPGQVRAALRPDTVLVSMMLVNNELGTVLPVAETARAIRESGCPALLHCDAVQGFLKVPFTPKELGADLLTISGHKVHGPKGIGALYVSSSLLSKNPENQAHKIRPLLFGGGQESKLRSGTEATAQMAGFAAAAGRYFPSREADWARMRELKTYTLRSLKRALPELAVVSQGDAPHICAVSLPGYNGENLVRFLGDRDICVSSGSACHKGKPSHVYAALGLPKAVLSGVLRLSFDPSLTEEDADALVSGLRDAKETLFPAMR